jgi:hypothetical protein
MLENKPITAKLQESGGRKVARQGAAFGSAVSENFKATAEETTAGLEKTYSIVATGASRPAARPHDWHARRRRKVLRRGDRALGQGHPRSQRIGAVTRAQSRRAGFRLVTRA